MEEHYKEVSYFEENLTNNTGSEAKKDEFLWTGYSERALLQEEEKNPILLQLEDILDNLKDWERQLIISRANGIQYTQIEEMTGKKADYLKVHYQRLKQRISKELKKSIKKKEEASCPKIKETE